MVCIWDAAQPTALCVQVLERCFCVLTAHLFPGVLPLLRQSQEGLLEGDDVHGVALCILGVLG
jgi:hypothetical protein